MDTKPVYKVSLVVNAVLSIIFIIVIVLGIIGTRVFAPATIIIITVFLAAYCCFLLFNLLQYQVLKANHQKQVMPDWCSRYGKTVFIFSILAVIAAAFMLLAATVAFLVEMDKFPKRQWPFYIIFLVLLCLSIITAVVNAVHYRRAIKVNRSIINSLINNIGENQ